MIISKQSVGRMHRAVSWTALIGVAAQGIPLREMLQSCYQIFRGKTLNEALLFLVHATLLLVWASLVVDVQVSYMTSDTVSNILLHQEGTPGMPTTFWDIGTMEDFWGWLNGPFYAGMYPTGWYNGWPLSGAEEGYMLHYNRLVGPIELRQNRVGFHSCNIRRCAGACTYAQTRPHMRQHGHICAFANTMYSLASPVCHAMRRARAQVPADVRDAPDGGVRGEIRVPGEVRHEGPLVFRRL